MGRPWPTKMTEEKVKLLRQKRIDGARIVDLAKEFDISKGTVSKIFNRQIWISVP